MKKILMMLFLMLTSIVSIAQNPFMFMGVPIDGNKAQFVKELSKVYSYYSETDSFEGRFNGRSSWISVRENHGKVDRIMVMDAIGSSETDIRISYNNLLQKFNSNPKFFAVNDNQPIPEGEDISYEMMINNKKYEASYHFDSYYGYTDEAILTEFKNEIGEEKYETLDNEQLERILNNLRIKGRLQDILDNSVWFTVYEHYGKYYIVLYYDNLKNAPNGEDL